MTTPPAPTPKVRELAHDCRNANAMHLRLAVRLDDLGLPEAAGRHRQLAAATAERLEALADEADAAEGA